MRSQSGSTAPSADIITFPGCTSPWHTTSARRSGSNQPRRRSIAASRPINAGGATSGRGPPGARGGGRGGPPRGEPGADPPQGKGRGNREGQGGGGGGGGGVGEAGHCPSD